MRVSFKKHWSLSHDVASQNCGVCCYCGGYTAAETKAQQENQAAAEQLRQAQYRASQTYQAAKAEREAAEKLRKRKVHEITQRDSYQRDCIDADGLRELNAAIGKKSAAR